MRWRSLSILLFEVVWSIFPITSILCHCFCMRDPLALPIRCMIFVMWAVSLVFTRENSIGILVAIAAILMFSFSNRCLTFVTMLSVALSMMLNVLARLSMRNAAAAVGVFTFVCATMSIILSSRSCPMPVIIGNGKFATFSARVRVSNPDMSVVAPPPRIITTMS